MKLALVAVGLVSMAGMAFAADIDVSKLPPASTKKDLTYEKDILPIFKESCFNCHGETGRASGGLRLHNLEATLKGGTDGKFVEPGQAVKSQLLISVSRLDPDTAMPRAPRGRGRGPGGPGGPGGRGTNAPAGTNAAAMPPAGAPGRGPAGPPPKNLTPEQVGLVRAWIDQGAK